MTQAEAEELLRKKEGRLCIRFFQREDGTVLTANCPVGLSALRKRLAWISAGIAAGFFLAASGALSVWGKMRGQPENSASQPSPPSTAAPVQALTNWANPPAPPPTTGGRMVMGDWCPAPVKSAPAPAPVPATPQK
jgi:hypothetical protein